MKMLLTFLLFVCVSPVLYAQQEATGRTGQPRCRPCPRRIVKTVPATASTPQPSADFYVGDARVDVVKDQTVVRLAMAQHGSVLIEVPANDGPRYIIPGDPEMATVDQKALERNKRAIIVRPGTLFVPPARNAKARTPAATVTAQMRSGLVVTFLFYPVEDLAQNVHRCVLSYNRDEVVARRRAAGLPVNLDLDTRGEMTVQSAAPATISVESISDSEKKTLPSPSPLASPSKPAEPPKSDEEPKVNRPASPTEDTKTRREFEAVSYIRGALQQAIKQPEEFKQWTRPSNGLKLSQVSVPIMGHLYSIVIIAIKNTTNNSLKFLATSPDLVIETVNDKGKPVNIESLKYLHVEASDSTQTIPAQGTTYYAVAYSPPVLGTNQQIRLSVAHSNAADQPVSIILNNGGK